jgi:hypothetical protein
MHVKKEYYELRGNNNSYTYANATLMSTSEGLSTGRSGDSRSHQWCLVVDGNVAYHLAHNTDKSWKNPGNGASIRA